MKKIFLPPGFIEAARLLTAIPCPAGPPQCAPAVHGWFPVIGFLLGALVALLSWLAWRVSGGWNEGAGLVALAAGALLTRGLHLDGLCDWADGFWGGYTREKTLAIMKDSRIGAFGATALFIVLCGKWAALSKLAASGGWLWIPASFAIARLAAAVLAATQPYAGIGPSVASDFVTNTAPRHAVAALAATTAILAVMPGIAAWRWAALLSTVLAGTLLFGRWCRRRVGGVTGDLLGAAIELSEFAALTLAAVPALR